MLMNWNDTQEMTIITCKIQKINVFWNDTELVECLNEEDKRYRFYSITEKGKYYLDKVEKEYND